MDGRPFYEDEDCVIRAFPDPQGVTLRTRYKGTQEALDQIAQHRIPKHTRVNTQGAAWHPGCSFPAELYWQLTVAMGRQPTAGEMLAMADLPEFKMLKATEKRLKIAPEDRAFAKHAESLLREQRSR